MEGCQQILRGETPFYFSDADNDYSHLNAESVKRYASEDRRELFQQLEHSFQVLKEYLLSMEPSQWEADYGVRYDRWTITVANTLEALADDYDSHRQEIEVWASNQIGR